MKEYKSSLSRLMQFFETSRDGWKAKAAEKQKTIERLKGEVRKKNESRDYWKAKAKRAEKAVRELEEKLSLQRHHWVGLRDRGGNTDG